MTDPREIAQRVVDFVYSDEGREATDEKQIEAVAAILAAEMPRWVPDFQVLASVIWGARDSYWKLPRAKRIEYDTKVSGWGEDAYAAERAMQYLQWADHIAALPSPPREEAK